MNEVTALNINLSSLLAYISAGKDKSGFQKYLYCDIVLPQKLP